MTSVAMDAVIADRAPPAGDARTERHECGCPPFRTLRASGTLRGHMQVLRVAIASAP